MHDALLIELLTEELPPKALKRLSDAFSDTILNELIKRKLVPRDTKAKTFATPRRLAVMIESVLDQANDEFVELKGPSTKIGLDVNGAPTQALIKWAEKQGVKTDALTKANDGKQDCFYAKVQQRGAQLSQIIQELIEQAIAKLPIPKLMQYQLADGKTNVSFVRPAHRLLALFGSKVLPCTILGLASDRLTQGHRFQSNGQALSIAQPKDYAQVLRQARVEPDFEARKLSISTQLQAQAALLGARLSNDLNQTDAQSLVTSLEPYLDEVCALVEWPKVYVGKFETDFLTVPPECLILTMRTNQKYFPLFDLAGKLTEKFLIVSNMDVADPVNIIDGNQRVVRPRLSDAQFFFEQDKKQTLTSRSAQLQQVVYHAKLGSQADRMKRVAHTAQTIAQRLGANIEHAQRAAELAKCDLVTDMVGEFPELQGIMGQYYALHDGEQASVAKAVAQHYQPKFAGDAVPDEAVGLSVALADKLETLCGIWGIGQLPTGDKDPFALRRQMLGVLRMVIEKSLPVKLSELLNWAFDSLKLYPGSATVNADISGLIEFAMDRLRGYLRDQGFQAAAVEAVLANNGNDLSTVISKVKAVEAFAQLPQAQALAAANKRIGNILKKSAGENTQLLTTVNTELFSEPAEQQLYTGVVAVQPTVKTALQAGRYSEALSALAQLREPVDHFFDTVMVMADDPAVRANRIGLLAQLHQMMNASADLARLAA
jgi:glycyl-tRNA synthetase beta chain